MDAMINPQRYTASPRTTLPWTKRGRDVVTDPAIAMLALCGGLCASVATDQGLAVWLGLGAAAGFALSGST